MNTFSLKPLLVALLAALVASVIPLGASAEPSANQIAKRSLQAFYYAGGDMRVRVSMSLINKEGKKRHRELTMLRKNIGASGDQRYFVFFHKPAEVKGMTFMVWKYPAKEDDRWIFLPAVKMVRRVAASDKRSSFVGSDFTYEDVSGRDVGDETHKLLRSADLGGRPCFVLESRPKGGATYARRVSWIDKTRWLPLHEDYFDARGGKVREFSVEGVKQIGGHWTVTKRTMKNLQTGHRSVAVFKDVSYDVGLKKNVFTEHSLRNPPRRRVR